jgi:peptidoglycan/LPS O-acetylase OafA/YrhL
LRIFPAYYVFLVISFSVRPLLGRPVEGSLVLSSASYLLNYWQAFGYHRETLVSHGWSLAIEEQFYLLWPAALIALSRPGRAIRRWLVAAIVVVLLWRCAVVLWGGPDHGYAYVAFDTRADSLLIGCVLAIGVQDPWLQRLARHAARHVLLPVVSIVLLHLVATRLSDDWTSSIGFTLESVLLALLMIQAMMLSGTRSWGWLNGPIIRYLGAISYPLYLYHQLARIVVELVDPSPGLVPTLSKAALAIGMAAASYHLVERRFLRLKRRWEVVPTA